MEKDRHFPRLNLSCDLEYNIDTNAEENPSDRGSSKTKDISAGGMCFITYTELPIGTALNLTFDLKDGTPPIQVKGRIVWTERFDIGGQQGWDNGIQFINIPADSRESLLKYIGSML